jgi:NitT/TauT family transport system permease protein
MSRNATLPVEPVEVPPPAAAGGDADQGESWRRITLKRTLLLVVLLAAWQLASGRLIQPFWISSPLEVAQRLADWHEKGKLMPNIGVTLFEALSGFLIGTIAGGAVGLLLGWFRRLADLLDPFIIGLYSLPKVALAPLFILWFGIGLQMKVILTAVIVFFLVFFNTYSGVRDTSRELIDIIRLMGAGTGEVVRRVVLPSALTAIFVGLRVSIPYAMIGAVVAEMMASNRGVGYLLVDSTGQFDTAGAFAALTLLLVLSLALNAIVVRLERYLLRWKRVSR